MTGEAELRLEFLREAGDLLWPAPARFVIGGPPPATDQVAGEFVMVPDARRPRILVPAGAPRAAAAALRGYGETGSAVARLRTRGLSWLLRAGAPGRILLRDRVRVLLPDGHAGHDLTGTGTETVEDRLRSALGEADVLLALYVRPARRANRKPVLQVLSRGGEVTGFVKVGIDPLTRSLVRDERDALRALAEAPLREVTAPRVLHHEEWRDLDLLVLSALPVWQRRRALSPERLAAAMVEIASVGGVRHGPLSGSDHLGRLTHRVTALGQDPAVPAGDAGALDAALRALVARAGDLELAYGAWHGDFSPWNMAAVDGTVLVWDWERFTTGVPLGFDALHHHLQSTVVRPGADPRAAADGCVAGAAELLAPFGASAAQARVTALLYLIELSVRYLEDRQAEAGALLGAPGAWLIPVLAAHANDAGAGGAQAASTPGTPGTPAESVPPGDARTGGRP